MGPLRPELRARENARLPARGLATGAALRRCPRPDCAELRPGFPAAKRLRSARVAQAAPGFPPARCRRNRARQSDDHATETRPRIPGPQRAEPRVPLSL